MKKKRSDSVDSVSAEIAERAKTVVDDGYAKIEIMKSAMSDYKAIGSIAGMISVASTGTLNKEQVEIAKRVAVKIIAVLSIIEQEKSPQ